MLSVKVTGKEYKLPKEFREATSPYEEIAVALFYEHSEVGDKYKGNLKWAQRILEKGPENDHSGYAYAAATVANVIDAIDEPLELVLGSKKPSSIGVFLEKGTIIVRGDLGKETGHSMRGGYLFVDGDVDQVKSMMGGVIYVSGDVGEIESFYHGVLIVAGGIKKCGIGGSLNSSIPVKPSPFVFTTSPFEYFGYGPKYCIGDIGNEPRQQSIVLPKDELREWNPMNFRKKSLELCKRVLNEDLNKKKRTVESVGTIKEVVEFYNHNIDGHYHGYREGYRKGTIDHLPDSD